MIEDDCVVILSILLVVVLPIENVGIQSRVFADSMR